ncbi:MAG: hypothetical protein JRH07_14730 [Deltaproteobacteria bacterium]|nr:hypothetical protein [Deltaproteobacteria bacterium]
MIDFIFTLDYEIYGNGTGGLRELVYEPTERLASIFREHGATFVIFTEVAELEKIEEYQADEAIDVVKHQLRRLYEEGFEIALHLHPQWYNAKRESGRWMLDSSEYNLCTLPEKRIEEIVSRALDYLQNVLGNNSYIPLSFRAGNWLFQPTATAARVLHRHGIRVDSSVFKGGFQRNHNLDYRPALKNGNYWRFEDDVNISKPDGPLLEVPIYTELKPFWKMLHRKRLGMQCKSLETNGYRKLVSRLRDFARFRYPRKLDFCRMGYDEMRNVMRRVMRIEREKRHDVVPIVSIGHSKDLVDFDSVRKCLTYLSDNSLRITDFKQATRQM